MQKKGSVKNAKLFLLAIPVWGLLLPIIFWGTGRFQDFFSWIPPQWHLTVLGILMVGMSVLAYLFYRKSMQNSKIEQEFLLEDGSLLITTRREGRGEQRVEMKLCDLTFVENDEERIVIESPHGKFIFGPMEFASEAEYERFQMELTCEKYKT